MALGTLVLVLFDALIWGLQQSAVRISHIEVLGADASFSSYATNTMNGWYLGIIPRNSIFFFSEERIRTDILSAHMDIAAVSIFRNGFTGISIKTDYRVPIARWCGSTPSTDSGQGSSPQAVSTSSPQAASFDEDCYVFDAGGVIFSTVSSTTQTVNTFRLYAPLEGETEGTLLAGRQVLHATIANADTIPTVFDFARQLNTFGSPVISIVMHDGEVDNNLTSGTRITYMLGHEQDAFTALVSARTNLNLADGSIEYVDLRFDGKVYLKKKE